MLATDAVIHIDNVSKQYRLGQIGTGTLSQDLNRWWHQLRGKDDPYAKIGERNDAASANSEYIWALKDVSFAVRQGEVVGIIGKNGAGKSTLLKILSRITRPTSGEIRVRGRIASLLEVGTGFHPDLTGRENILLNGAILGMRKRDIERKFDEIVDFSGCERYIDTPVKRYSSGMYVRLAFSVAAHLDPDILVIDEALAVGDAEFQDKCLGKMQGAASAGRTVLFVSHNMGAVASLCDRGVLLDAGRVIQQGSIAEVVNTYLSTLKKRRKARCQWTGPAGDDRVEIVCAAIRGGEAGPLPSHRPITVDLELNIRRAVDRLVVGWKLWNEKGHWLAYSAADDAEPPPGVSTPRGYYRFSMLIPANTLATGIYNLCLDVCIHNTWRITREEDIWLELVIDNTAGIGRRYPHKSLENLVRSEWPWQVSGEPCAETGRSI